MDLIPNKKSNGSVDSSTVRRSLLGLDSGTGQILTARNLERWGILLLRGAVVLLVVLVLLGGLFYFFNWRTGRQISVAQKEQSALLGQLQEPGAVNLKNYVRQISAFSEALTKKTASSFLFDALEKNTVPEVMWGALQVNVAAGSCQLAGRAANYLAIARQIVAFKQAGFSGLDFRNLKLSQNGGIDFDATVVFDSSLKTKTTNE